MTDATRVHSRSAPSSPRVADGAPAGSETTRIELGDFLTLCIQLGLVLGVAFFYRIELERGFGVVAGVTFLGFLVHSWLPLRARLPFFLFLTVLAVGILLRAEGVWLIGLGLALLGLCHLPIAWSARVALVLAAVAVLAFIQAGWLEAPWTRAVIPVLAAMFMFRLFLYLYDLKKDRTPAGFWQRLAYFFLLPNVCFPLFPVVDYKTFIRTYYNAPASEIYQKGVYWILRGLGHIVLYRILYYLLPRADSDLTGILGVYVFAAMTYGLYLRVSGLFHLIVGILCLFGFNLPSTNNHYFLASSFTDLWRRINIYWKDFMMTVVFYPVFMSLRRWNMNARLLLGTGAVFLVTWFLHSYQWFWLQGMFPVTVTDIAFWSLLGVALAVNTVWEAYRGPRGRLTRGEQSLKESLGVTARTIAVFSTMAILWSLWYSDSAAEWGYRLLRVRESGVEDWAVFAALVGAALLIGMGAQRLRERGWGLARLEELVWRQAARVVPATAAAMLALGLPFVHEELGGPIHRSMVKVQSTQLNRIDLERQERGYYETLSRATRFGPAAAMANEAQDADELRFRQTSVVRETGDIRGFEIIPNAEIVFRGALFRANRWGFRDREYEKAKPAGTYRIALLGSSHVMGWGVANNETFENLVEDRLNRELKRRGFGHYEILNFAVAGYALPHSLYQAEQIVPEFDPDVVMYVVHPGEEARLVKRLRILMIELQREVGGDYTDLQSLVQHAGAHAGLPAGEFERRLRPYREQLFRSSARRWAAAVRATGAVPVLVFLPLTDRTFDSRELDRLTALARDEGASIIDLSEAYAGQDVDLIRVSEVDNHPNAFGHGVLADRLYSALLDHAEAIGLLDPARGALGSSYH